MKSKKKKTRKKRVEGKTFYDDKGTRAEVGIL